MLFTAVFVSLCLAASLCDRTRFNKRKREASQELPSKRQCTGPNVSIPLELRMPSKVLSCTPLDLGEEDEIIKRASEYTPVSEYVFSMAFGSALETILGSRPGFLAYFTDPENIIPYEELVFSLELIKPSKELCDVRAPNLECTEDEVAKTILYDYFRMISEGPLSTAQSLKAGHFVAYLNALGNRCIA